MTQDQGSTQLTEELRTMHITETHAVPFRRSPGQAISDNLRDSSDVPAAFPIHCLPPEVLSLVFYHVVLPRLNQYGHLDVTGDPAVLHRTVFTDFQPGSLPLTSSPRPQTPWKKTVVLSLVCTAWRSLLLNTPSVWTYMQGARPERIEEMLSRSGTVPFTLCHNSTPDESCYPPLAASLGRMKELVLFRRTARGLQECMDQLLGVETPALESLAIVAPCWPLTIDLPQEIITLPRPALRHLTLLDCKLPDDCTPCFPRLLTLHMKLLNAPAAQVLYDMLSSSLEVEVLWLYWFVSIPPAEPGSLPYEDVHLAHLSHLTMAFDLRDSVHLLSYLRYPKTAKQRFRFTTSASGSLPQDEWHIWTKALVGRLGLDGDNNSFTHAFVNLGSLRQSSVYVWKDDQCEGHRDNENIILRNAVIVIDVCHSHVPDVNLFSAFCAAILLPDLSSLCITQKSRSGHVDHSDLLNRHPQIRHLQLEGDAAAEAILPILTRSLLSVQSGNMCFPKLRDLRLKNVTLREPTFYDDYTKQILLQVPTQLYLLLVGFLGYRAKCLQELGIGFETIGLYHCPGMEVWMEEDLIRVLARIPGLRREVDVWR